MLTAVVAGFLEVGESITDGGRRNGCEVVSLEHEHRGVLQATAPCGPEQEDQWKQEDLAYIPTL